MRILHAIRSLGTLSIAIAALSSFLTGCRSSESMSPLNVTLEPYLMPTSGGFVLGPQIVGTSANGESVAFYPGEIEGFTFTWGYRQTLRLNRSRVAVPMEDAPSIEYSLAATLAKVPVPDWSFRTFPQDTAALQLDGDTLRIRAYDRAIYIAADSDRAMLTAKGGEWMDLRVRNTSTGLAGDSVRVLHPDSTGGHWVPE